MRQRSQSATLILPLGIEQVDDILRRQPLVECARLITECVFLCFTACKIDDAVLKRPATVLFAIAESFRGRNAMTRDALVLRESSCGFCEQDENFPIDVDRGRPPKQVGFEVVHPTSRITDAVKYISQKVGRCGTEYIIQTFVDRDECSTDRIHSALIDRIFDRAEIQIDSPGMRLQSDPINRWHQITDVLFLGRLPWAITSFLRCPCRFVTNLPAELIEYCHVFVC